MAVSTQYRSEAERVGIETIIRAVDGKTVQFGRVSCAACQTHSELRQKVGAPANRLKQDFQASGWTGFGKRPLCPQCGFKPGVPVKPTVPTRPELEEPPMLPKQKISKAAMAQMPAPTARQVVAIADALAEHLNEGRYRSGWSDHRVGNDLKIPAALVAKVREDLHGPLKGNPEIDSLRGELSAWFAIGDDLRNRLNHLEQTRT